MKRKYRLTKCVGHSKTMPRALNANIERRKIQDNPLSFHIRETEKREHTQIACDIT